MNDWRQYKNGQRWRRLSTGEIEVEGQGVIRTAGDPISTYTAWVDFEPSWQAAKARFKLDLRTLIAMALIEATRLKEEHAHMDPQCVRLEPGYVSDGSTPRRMSAGLMQTLLSTAQSMNAKERLFTLWDGNLEYLGRGDLFMPHKSIMLGAAYMRDRADAYNSEYPGDDPVILTGSYNAGSLKEDKPDAKGQLNPFMIRTYGPDRTEKFIRYYNDAHHALEQLGVCP